MRIYAARIQFKSLAIRNILFAQLSIFFALVLVYPVNVSGQFASFPSSWNPEIVMDPDTITCTAADEIVETELKVNSNGANIEGIVVAYVHDEDVMSLPTITTPDNTELEGHAVIVSLNDGTNDFSFQMVELGILGIVGFDVDNAQLVESTDYPISIVNDELESVVTLAFTCAGAGSADLTLVQQFAATESFDSTMRIYDIANRTVLFDGETTPTPTPTGGPTSTPVVVTATPDPEDSAKLPNSGIINAPLFASGAVILLGGGIGLIRGIKK